MPKLKSIAVSPLAGSSGVFAGVTDTSNRLIASVPSSVFARAAPVRAKPAATVAARKMRVFMMVSHDCGGVGESEGAVLAYPRWL